MLKWAMIFLVSALVFALFGFTEIAGDLAIVAQILFGVFILGVIVIGVLSVAAWKRIT